MLKKTLIATATAGLISAGALVGTATTAAAHGPGGPGGGVQFGGPGWSVQFGFGNQHRPRQVCRPVFQTVKWWDRWGRPHFKRVVVRQECNWVYRPGPYPGPFPGQYPGWGGPNPGWGYPHP